MAATFRFKLGSLDLSSYLRVNPDDKMDPQGAPWLQPAFAESPFSDGQPLLSTTVGNRETLWPLFLSDDSHLKDQLHALIRKIGIAAQERPLLLEWRDDSASSSSFADVAFVRFDPDFNYRRSVHGYAVGVLHIWTSGYYHTGTVRIAATAAGTGIFLSVPVASIAGDAPALLDTTIKAGAVLPSLGRIAALAPIGHPSYAALVPAASLLSAQPGATLVGASGAQGSQYLALPVSPTGGASGIACKVPLQNPTIAGGDNRILAVVKSGITGGVGITALDPYGNAMGPTAVASMSAGWGLVDLGVCQLPTVGYPTLPELTIQAGGIWASGAAGPGISASPAGLALNEVICLPDKNLSLVLETAAAGSLLSLDTFPGDNTPLLGANDAFGHPWTAAYNHAHSAASPAPGFATGGALEELAGAAGRLSAQTHHQTGTTALLDADHVAAVLADSMVMRIYVAGMAGGAEEVRLFKDIQPSAFVQARMAASGFLALETATGGVVGNLLASVSLATIGFYSGYRFALQVQSPGAFVTLSRGDGGPVFAPASMAQASIGVASNAAISGAGVPALGVAVPSYFAANGVVLESWEVGQIGSSNLQVYDAYRFDGPNTDVYRAASSGVFGAKLMNVQRGAFPKAAPSTSSVAVVCAPFDQGTANDLISAVVSCKERYTYSR